METKIKEFQQNIVGISTFYLHAGQGEPIVFLHGVPSSSYLWRKVMLPLAEKFSCYAPDLPGYACSENPSGFSLKDYSRWLFDFRNFTCPDKKINLVVHDIGGPIGLAFVLEHPEKINRLVVMDTIDSTKNLTLWMKIVVNRVVI